MKKISTNLDGSRIINLDHMTDQHAATCSGTVELVGEKSWSGLGSILSSKCNKCTSQHKVKLQDLLEEVTGNVT